MFSRQATCQFLDRFLDVISKVNFSAELRFDALISDCQYISGSIDAWVFCLKKQQQSTQRFLPMQMLALPTDVSKPMWGRI